MQIVTTSYDTKEIRALGVPEDHFVAVGVKVAQAAGNLAEGTLLGKITASGLYKAYNNANSDGSEKAVGILAFPADAQTAGQNIGATMFVKGYFKESALTGLDEAAKADMGARSAEGVLIV